MCVWDHRVATSSTNQAIASPFCKSAPARSDAPHSTHPFPAGLFAICRLWHADEADVCLSQTQSFSGFQPNADGELSW
jgi:hypothetical protein